MSEGASAPSPAPRQAIRDNALAGIVEAASTNYAHPTQRGCSGLTAQKSLATELVETVVMGGVTLTTRTHAAIQAVEVALADTERTDA